MDEPNYDLGNFQESFEKMKGRIHVLERSVPVEVQMEYFRASKRMRRTLNANDRASDEECGQWYAELCGTADTFLPLSVEERRHFWSRVVLGGWCWYVWALEKEAEGAGVGEWLYIYFSYADKYLDRALALYEEA